MALCPILSLVLQESSRSTSCSSLPSFPLSFVLGGSRHDVWPQNQALSASRGQKMEKASIILIKNQCLHLSLSLSLCVCTLYNQLCHHQKEEKKFRQRNKKPTTALEPFFGDRHGMSIQCLPSFSSKASTIYCSSCSIKV